MERTVSPARYWSVFVRTRLLASGLILLAASVPASAQSGFTLTSPTAGSLVPAGQAITVTWTGGDPSATVNLLLIDQQAFAVYQGFGLGPNTGSRVVTISASYGPGGTCGRTFSFYLEDAPRTTWTYGNVFTVTCADAENVKFVFVSKGVNFVQTSDAAPVLDPTPPGPFYGGPFSFDASVEGTDLASIPPPTVTVPPGSGILSPWWAQIYNGGVLGYNTNDQAWQFGAPNFNNFGAQTASDVNSLFPSGPYTFSVLGATVTLNLVPPATPFAPPAFTLTGGTWTGGKYVVDVRNPVTITSSAFTGYSANGNGVVAFSLGSETAADFVGEVVSWHSADPDADRISFTIEGCRLAGGHDYRAYGEFAAIVDYSTGVAGIPSSHNFAYFFKETGFVLAAVGTCDDTTAPVITSVTTSAPALWPPDHRLVPISVNVAATDDVSSVTSQIVSVTSNEPDNGLGDGDTAGDIDITGPLTVKLRAERDGRGSGRLYTIVVEVADESGNTAREQVQVLVPRRIPRP